MKVWTADLVTVLTGRNTRDGAYLDILAGVPKEYSSIGRCQLDSSSFLNIKTFRERDDDHISHLDLPRSKLVIDKIKLR